MPMCGLVHRQLRGVFASLQGLPGREQVTVVVALALAGWYGGARAQASGPPPVPTTDTTAEARVLDTVEVTGHRLPLSAFPGAVDVLAGDSLRSGQRRVNLSEAIQRVPGFTVRDRGNYAQDLQVQSRGFGARSTFGIRGLRLVADGIPLSASDGQGQAAGFPLDTLDRVEVLRGPLALRYGNASGGAIVGHSDLDGDVLVGVDAWGDDAGARRASARWDGGSGPDWRWRVAGSHFRTPGERPHAEAERRHGVAHVLWQPDDARRLQATFNTLSQPWTEDPLGLTRAQWDANPDGESPVAEAFDTRKRIANHQLAVRWECDASARRAWWLSAHGGVRAVEQFLAIPAAAQGAPTSAGGVVDVDRLESGLEAGHRWHGPRGSVAAGVDIGRLSEARRGYENFVDGRLGVRGRLRRDEHNRVSSRAVFVVAEMPMGAGINALAGARQVRSAFESRDRYFAPGNGDDSGRVDYAEHAVSFGIARKFANGEAFASLGQGFETPTVTELSYRPDGGPGLNLGLRPAKTRSIEAGLRHRAARHRLGLTAYRIDGRDEIVAATSSGGRASYANAGSTRREGVELGVDGHWGAHWKYALAANWIRARFTEGFAYRVFSDGSLQSREVSAGNRLPGIPRADAFSELVWHHANDRLQIGLEGRWSDRVFVDDRNTDVAPGYALVALRVSWQVHSSGWNGFARIDNLFDRAHVGSVIVNEGNSRFFEPGAGRTITVGLGWRSR